MSDLGKSQSGLTPWEQGLLEGGDCGRGQTAATGMWLVPSSFRSNWHHPQIRPVLPSRLAQEPSVGQGFGLGQHRALGR